MQIESWLIFFSVALIATMTPGPAILLVTAHSLQFGLLKSIATMFGNISGLFLMSILSVVGLGTAIFASSLVFNMIKIIGAVYLIYMGIKLWRNGIKCAVSEPSSTTKKQVFSLYRQGLLVSLTNPKAIVFITALFPQFISTNEPLAVQFSVLLITFMSLSFTSLFFYSIVTQIAKKRSVGIFEKRWTGKVFGGVFVGAGLILGSSQR